MMEREPHNTSDLRAVAPWLAIGGVLIALLAGIVVWQQFAHFPSLSKTTVTHSLVTQQIQNVAKLVTSEAVMRDVVVFEDTWLGSTKRSLVVVTAKVMAGINLEQGLEQGSDVKIDEAAKKIRITLPQAIILATDISEMKTYDEQRGLWNAFEASDRDKIFQQARTQFQQAAQQSRLTERAKQMLETMFSRDGFTAEVTFR